MQIWARTCRQQLKGAGVLTSACARGSETGKCLGLLCMKTASLFNFFFPQLHFIIQLLDALAASWKELSIVHCWLEGRGRREGNNKAANSFLGVGTAQSALSSSRHPLLLNTHWPIDSPRHTREHRTLGFAPDVSWCKLPFLQEVPALAHGNAAPEPRLANLGEGVCGGRVLVFPVERWFWW